MSVPGGLSHATQSRRSQGATMMFLWPELLWSAVLLPLLVATDGAGGRTARRLARCPR